MRSRRAQPHVVRSCARRRLLAAAVVTLVAAGALTGCDGKSAKRPADVSASLLATESTSAAGGSDSSGNASAAAASKAAASRAAASKAAASKAAASRAAASRAAASKAAASKPAATPPPPIDCTPGYSPCIPEGTDVDCAGGEGDGPRYVKGPIIVTGRDPYGLDGNNDGIGCAA